MSERAPSAPGPPDPARERAARRGIPLVGAATLCLWTSLYLYVPVLPLHAEDLGASATMIGIVVAAYAIGQVTLRIPIGVAADILGRRKPFAFACLLASALGGLWLALAPDPWSLFAARTLTGVAAAGWVAVSVLFASYFPPNRLTGAMASLMTVNGLALLGATLVGGIMADYLGIDSTFYAASAVALVGAGLLALAPEPPLGERPAYSAATLLRVIRSPLLLQVAAIGIALQFVTFGAGFGFTPVYAESLGASESQIGYITTVLLTAAVVGTVASVFLVRRLGNRGAILLCCAAMTISVGAVPLVSTLLPLGGLQVLNGIGRGAVNTILIGLSLRAAPPAERATAMGAYQAIYAIGMFAGPAVSGPIADSLGLNAVFYLGAGVAALGALIVFAGPLPRT